MSFLELAMPGSDLWHAARAQGIGASEAAAAAPIPAIRPAPVTTATPAIMWSSILGPVRRVGCCCRSSRRPRHLPVSSRRCRAGVHARGTLETAAP